MNAYSDTPMVKVAVDYSAGAYHARLGKLRASCTAGPMQAARALARKHFGSDLVGVRLVHSGPLTASRWEAWRLEEDAS